MRNWRIVQLADVADIRVSGVDKLSFASEKPVRLCNYMDVYANDYVRADLPFMEATATAAEIARFKVVQGDVMITKDSETPEDIGISSVVSDEIEGLVCAYHLALLKPNRSLVDSIYLSKQLATPATARYFARNAAGSTRYGLSNRAIERTPVPLAPLNQQKKIAAILTSIDTAIEKTEALIAKYQQIKAGLMHDLFTRGVLPNGQLRPPREQAPELYQGTAIGWIPRDWQVSALAAIADLLVGFAFKSESFVSEGIPLLRGENVGYGCADWSDRQCLALPVGNEFSTYILKAGDLVVGMDRSFTKSGVKITALTVNDCPALLVQRVGKFRAIGCEFLYLRWLVESPAYLRILFNQQKGMDIPHLSKAEILTPIIPIPPTEEQVRIAMFIESAAELIASTRTELEKLTRQKLGLMQDLLTGKVPVKVHEPTPELLHA